MDNWEGFWACCATASFSFLELPASFYNHHEAAAMRTTMKMILSTEWKEICMIGKALGLVVLWLPTASSSFLELPTASSSSPRPPRSYTTRELIISTEWKEVWTVGKGSELLRCSFLQLPR